MNYKVNRLIDGFKVSGRLSGKEIIQVNSRKWEKLKPNDVLKVTIKETGDVYLLTGKMKPSKRIKFKDKYRRGGYYMLYFVAKKEFKELTLF